MKNVKRREPGNIMIIIDTDVLIEIFDRHSERGEIAMHKIDELGEDTAITSLNLHEILYGLEKYGNKVAVGLLAHVETIEFDREDAKLSAKLELSSDKKGRSIPRIDSMIAAIAINRKAKLFTYNRKHFEDFEELELLKFS